MNTTVKCPYCDKTLDTTISCFGYHCSDANHDYCITFLGGESRELVINQQVYLDDEIDRICKLKVYI